MYLFTNRPVERMVAITFVLERVHGTGIDVEDCGSWNLMPRTGGRGVATALARRRHPTTQFDNIVLHIHFLPSFLVVTSSFFARYAWVGGGGGGGSWPQQFEFNWKKQRRGVGSVDFHRYAGGTHPLALSWCVHSFVRQLIHLTGLLAFLMRLWAPLHSHRWTIGWNTLPGQAGRRLPLWVDLQWHRNSCSKAIL